MLVIDVSDPAAPDLLGWWGGAHASVAMVGTTAYVGGSQGVVAVDISNPEEPVEFGFDWMDPDLPYAGDIVIVGQHLFAADRGAGALRVFAGCHLLVDGFESGDTTAWALTVP
jgi:hypothetical protein